MGPALDHFGKLVPCRNVSPIRRLCPQLANCKPTRSAFSVSVLNEEGSFAARLQADTEAPDLGIPKENISMGVLLQGIYGPLCNLGPTDNLDFHVEPIALCFPRCEIRPRGSNREAFGRKLAANFGNINPLRRPKYSGHFA